MKRKMNRGGWIRLIEAFMAILLLTSVLVIVVEYKQSNNVEIPSIIYQTQNFVLRTIELNETMRQEIISTEIPIMSWDQSFPQDIKLFIETNIPSDIECVSQICSISVSCELSEQGEIESNIYVQSVFISSTLTIYNPRQLKLFCWNK